MSKNKSKKNVSESEESEASMSDDSSFHVDEHKPQKNVLKRGQDSSPNKKTPASKKISKEKEKKSESKREPEKKTAVAVKKNNGKPAKDKKEPKEKDEKDGTSHFLPGQKHPTPIDVILLVFSF